MADQQAILELLIQMGASSKREIAELRAKLAELSTAFKGDVAEAALRGLDERAAGLAERLDVVQKRASDANLSLEEVGEVRKEMEAVSEAASQLGRNVEAIGVAAGGSTQSFGPLTDVVERAQGAVTTFAQSATSGSRETGLAAGRARKEIQDLEAAIRAAAAAGQDLGEAPAELERLKASYADATRVSGEFRAAQEQARIELDSATRAAGGAGRQINSLDDIVKTINPNLAALAVQGGLVAGAMLAVDRGISTVQRHAIELAKDIELPTEAQDELNKAFDRARDVLTEGSPFLLGVKALIRRYSETGAEARKLREEHEQILETYNDLVTGGDDLAKNLRETMIAVASLGDGWIKSRAQSRQALDMLVDLRDELTKHGRAVPEALNQWIALFEGIAGAAEKELPPVFEHLERLGVVAPDAINKGFNSLRQFITQLQETGRVSTEQADTIVSDAERWLSAIDSLPPEYQASYAAMKAALEGYVADHKDLTSEAVTDAESAAEKTKAAWQGAGQEIAALIGKLREGLAQEREKEDGGDLVKLPDPEEIKERLGAIRAELESLRNSQASGQGEALELHEREMKLLRERSDLEAQLRVAQSVAINEHLAKLGEQATLQEQASEGVLQLVQDSDSLRTAYKSLDESGRIAFRNAVQGFQNIVAAEGVTEQNLFQFAQAVRSVMEDAGQSAEEVVEEIEALGEQFGFSTKNTLTLANAFDRMDKEVGKAKEGVKQQGEEVEKTREKQKELAEQTGKLQKATEEHTKAIRAYKVDADAALSIDRQRVEVCLQLIECHRALKNELLSEGVAA